MDTTTCSPSWWPSPSSCSRPLFSTSARISSSNPHGVSSLSAPLLPPHGVPPGCW
ncbi:40S ribosomal protein S4-3 [Zea mays]|uniref:40S ribosomal protein S4-3 n=1 Tax=Zea mays TaxID=4577 RepID=A0A1D6K9U0_MAIZE|nr:40S ribosomal protein S4-3 [Zea mays]ONM00174.1 40S ribosomal protein S4-3 [Zea mays]ONM00176.1 40S ribosomal protein S4-3 [Zea mays]ONM00179.1 40S ribosomal protein S4-3 [Zea mays]ONM00180.1 40S ribosomal protein S4-3 [Zea mays]